MHLSSIMSINLESKGGFMIDELYSVVNGIDFKYDTCAGEMHIDGTDHGQSEYSMRSIFDNAWKQLIIYISIYLYIYIYIQAALPCIAFCFRQFAP